MQDGTGEQRPIGGTASEAVFRAANERIGAHARGLQTMELVPFLCECAEPTCTAPVRLTLEEYERVRGDSTWFVTAVGHELSAGEESEVVEGNPRYVVVRKLGADAETACALDARR